MGTYQRKIYSMRNKNYAPPKSNTKLTVKSESDLMTFLLDHMGGMKRNSVKSLLAHRQVSVNSQVITLYNQPLKIGDRVEISGQTGTTELTHSKLRIIFEDKNIVVVDKKEGLLTVSTGRGDETTVFSILKTHIRRNAPQNRIYVVHRLDRDTSGVLIFAKDKETQEILQSNWKDIVTKRLYVALVEGRVEKEKDSITSWLTEHPKSLKIRSSNVDNGGQRATTNIRRIKAGDQYSLLELDLDTGRKNQIRVHLQDIGHPVAGDQKYGAQTNPCGRMALHARLIEFYHPATNKKVKFESPVPKTFTKFVK
jgi:23S rRNA pseudouridine1911/1915/1917 synthase